MKRKQISNTRKRILFYGLGIVVIASFIVLAGEPLEPISFSEFIIPKIIAMAVLLGCETFGRHAQKMGWFPEGEKPFNED